MGVRVSRFEREGKIDFKATYGGLLRPLPIYGCVCAVVYRIQLPLLRAIQDRRKQHEVGCTYKRNR